MRKPCKYCEKPIETEEAYGKLKSGMTFYSDHAQLLSWDYFCDEDCYTRWRYGIPLSAVEVEDVDSARIEFSELAMHTGKAGRFVDKLWQVNDGTYGYATIQGNPDGASFLHGALNVHDSTSISLS